MEAPKLRNMELVIKLLLFNTANLLFKLPRNYTENEKYINFSDLHCPFLGNGLFEITIATFR